MGEGVITHYLPLKNSKNPNKTKEEKGIDVWLALEAYELAYYKRFNVLVLVACDGDYVPLVRKLNTLGTRVMLLSWDFKYLDQNNDEKVTRTSQDLLEEVTYPIAMHEIIENRVTKNEPTIENLFVNAERHVERETYNNQQEDFQESTIMHVKEGYGFIKYPPNNLFFHFSSLQNMDFNDLVGGEKVKFKIETKPDGQPVAVEVTVCKR
jgi:cold shock CspA family protein